jgi:hypothetical protein
MAHSPLLRSRLRPWLAAATVSAALLVPVGTAAATWHTAQITLIEFRDVCRDGIRFGGAVRDGSGPPTGPYGNRAVAVQPPPSSWREWNRKSGEVMNRHISIPRMQDDLDTADDEKVVVSHEGDFTMRYRNGPLQLGPVALSVENGNPDSNLNTADVTDCSLYAPIDVEPGKSANKVPIGHGEVSVAALATEIMDADRLTPSDFRFGPSHASATASERGDVNGDHRTDLVLRFSSVASGLECSTRTVELKGKTPSGGTFEGTDKVSPKGC